MASPTKRRPLPAVVLLAALTLLTSLVWWRVLNRDGGHASANPTCPTSSSSAGTLPQPAAVSVSVLNSTSRNGLAKATAGTLTTLGFTVAGFAQDLPKVHVAGVAEIRFGPDQKQAAALLAYYFPGAKLVPLAKEPTGVVVVSLGAKFTLVASSRTAAAAMKAAHVTLPPTNAPASPAPGSATNCPKP